MRHLISTLELSISQCYCLYNYRKAQWCQSHSLKALINMCQEPYVILYLGTPENIVYFLQFGTGKLGVHFS